MMLNLNSFNPSPVNYLNSDDILECKPQEFLLLKSNTFIFCRDNILPLCFLFLIYPITRHISTWAYLYPVIGPVGL